MNHYLLTPFSKEEIKFALFQIFPTKASEPDGFNALFYQHFLNTIKGKLVANFLNILNNRASVSDLNRTNIALIPKIEQPKMASDYCPISVCNVSYKLISKAIANRLKPIHQSIISKSQSAFVLVISDNIFVSYECVEHIMRKRNEKVGSVVMKLDISKALGFLERVMLQMGFSIHWVSLILNCISSVTFLVLINGKARGSSLKGSLDKVTLFRLIFSSCVLRVYRACCLQCFFEVRFQVFS